MNDDLDTMGMLIELLGQLREGQLDEAQATRLDAILAGDPRAREIYADYMFIWSTLGHYLVADKLVTGPAAGPFPLSAAARAPRPSAWRRLPMIAAAALAASLVIVALIFQTPDSVSGPQLIGGGAAVVTLSASAEWEQLQVVPGAGSMIAPGTLRLRSGVAQIEFLSGAHVVLEGPAELQVISASRAVLRSGKVRVHVPPHARGFAITTARAEVVDLGTEFGLVADESGTVEVHVFDGEVRLADRAAGAGSPQQSLLGGQGLRLSTAGPSERIDPDLGGFVDLAGLLELANSELEQSYQGWLSYRQRIADDPSLLLYYTFEPSRPWDRTVANEAIHGSADGLGALIGCQWSRGRWPAKSAVEFKRAGDRIRVTVPGRFDSITLAAWVRFDGFDRPLSSLMLTDGFEPGEPHWQVSDDGAIILGIATADGELDAWGARKVMWRSGPNLIGQGDLGRWLHLASTYDGRSGTITHYVDGRPASQGAVKAAIPLVIGAAEIGNWNAHTFGSTPVPIRNLNGRMDELAIFSRPLSPREVQAMYQSGKPQL